MSDSDADDIITDWDSPSLDGPEDMTDDSRWFKFGGATRRRPNWASGAGEESTQPLRRQASPKDAIPITALVDAVQHLRNALRYAETQTRLYPRSGAAQTADGLVQEARAALIAIAEGTAP